MELLEMSCCGMREITELSLTSGPADATRKFISRARYDRWSFAFVTFNGRASYCAPFAKFIRKHKLGKVVGVGPKKNPNSGNSIVAYLWTPNRRALEGWEKGGPLGKPRP